MTAVTRAYARTQGETASPQRLTVLMFEAALKNIRLAAAALESGRAPAANDSLGRAGDIVSQLIASLDHSHAPELCARLTEVYVFVGERLLAATVTRDPKACRDAERALVPIAEGFAEAVRAVEQGAASVPR
jgi:flagellar protein FliS